VFAVLAIILAASYLLDALQLRLGAFFTIWVSIIAADIAFFFLASLSSARGNQRPAAMHQGMQLCCCKASFAARE
jgi:hypothetical protein